MLGKKLLELRNETKMTQKEIAAKLNVSEKSYSNWERNIYYPKIVNLIKLSKLFKVRTNYLAGLDNIRHK